MPTDEQRKAIEEVLADRQEAIAAALIEEAETLVPVAVDSTLGELRRRTADKFTRQIVAGITKEQVAAYRAQVAKAGPISSSAWSRPSATAGLHHHPAHVQALAQRHGHSDQEGILRIISDWAARRHASAPDRPGTPGLLRRHGAQRCHRRPHGAQNSDRRPGCDLPEDGVHYLEYIAVGDDVTRPEHLARDGKIYPIDKARGSGNRTAGVSLIDADYRVEKKPPPWKNLTASP